MANYATLKAAIADVVKTNGSNAITGANLQQVLFSIVNSIGTGYLFAGVATPSTSVGTPDQNVFYLTGAGTFGNMGNTVTIPVGSIGVFKYNGSWSNSTVKVYDGPVLGFYDVSENNGGTTYATLSAALGAVPSEFQKGGMTIKFIQTSDNKYVQFRYMSSSTAVADFTNVDNWQGMDDEPTAGSENLVKSGGVENIVRQIKGLITETNSILQQSGIQWFYIPLSIKSGQTVKVKSTGSATVEIFRIYGNEFQQNTLNFTSINQEVTYTPENDINRLVVYVVNCSVAGSFTVEVKYGNSINSLEKDVEAIKGKVNVINSQYFIGDTSEFDKRIKEFYVEGLDKQQDYYIKFVRYSSGNIQLNLFKSDDTNVASLSQTYNTPIIRITEMNNSGIYGYAVINIDANDTSTIQATINKEKCCNLENSPIIKNYLNNLIKEDDCDAGYLKLDGELQTSAGFFTTKFLKIRNRERIFCYNTCAGNGTVYIGYALYDKDFTCLSAVTIAQTDNNVIAWQGGARASYVISNIPSNAKYIRVSYGDTNNTFIFLPSIIQDITQKSLDECENNLIEIINEHTSPLADYSSFKNNGTIAQNEYVLLPSVHIQRNSILSAKIKGTAEEVQIGVGYIEATAGHPNYRGYNAVWIKLTPTKAQLFVNYSEAQAGREYEHGLTLTNNTTVVITSRWDGNTETKTLQIYDEFGNMFETGLSWWGMGRPYVQNLGNASVDVELAFMPQDITRSLWVFGDSYLTLSSDQAWIYYIFEKHFENFLLNQRPGENAEEAWNDLNNLVNTNYKPRVLLWCLGMNGDGVEQLIDGQYVINDYQKRYIDNVVALCTEKGITPVFCTIPTVPTLQKTGLSNYVRNLGYQYVDVANAVGAQSDGTWYAGLLRADGVHPTAAGSKVIASRVMLDFPAIGVNG